MPTDAPAGVPTPPEPAPAPRIIDKGKALVDSGNGYNNHLVQVGIGAKRQGWKAGDVVKYGENYYATDASGRLTIETNSKGVPIVGASSNVVSHHPVDYNSSGWHGGAVEGSTTNINSIWGTTSGFVVNRDGTVSRTGGVSASQAPAASAPEKPAEAHFSPTPAASFAPLMQSFVVNASMPLLKKREPKNPASGLKMRYSV